MDKKHKIELIIISGLSLALIAIVFCMYRSRPKIETLWPSFQETILEDVAESNPYDYQLQSSSTGTKIRYLPASFGMVFPDDWVVEIVPSSDSEINAQVDAKLQNSFFDQNKILVEGCMVNLRFTRAPLRWQSVHEVVENMQTNPTNEPGSLQIISVGSLFGLSREHDAISHYFADISIPMNNYHLLEITASFSAKYKESCRNQLYQSLLVAEIN
jgi:hypothetical protein